MPIKALETRDATFPRLGKIKKGAEKPKSGPGKDLDYFRFDTQREDVRRAIVDIYGNEPREIRVWLPYTEVEDNFDPWMKEYSSGGIKRMCDGEQQHVWQENGKIRSTNSGDDPIPCVRETTGCQCKQVAHLKVMVAELFGQGILGYFALETHSINDIINITGNLNAAYNLRPNLCGIPFILRRFTQSISTPRGESRVRTDKSLISIEPDPAWVQSQFTRMYQASMSLPSAQPAAAFHGGIENGGGYLLPSHHVSESESSGLPVASPIARAEYSNPGNIDRLGQILKICGLSNEVARKIRIGIFGADRSVKTYTDQEISDLRGAFYVEAVKNLECWNHYTHARNAWNAFVAENPCLEEDDDRAMFDAWMSEVMDRCDAMTADVEVEVEAEAVVA